MSSLPRELVERVQTLSNDDAFHLLIDMMVHKYTEAWRTSAPDNTAHREHLYRMVQASEALRSEVRNIASDEAITAFNRSLQNKTKWSNI